jgi:hypothetical protein
LLYHIKSGNKKSSNAFDEYLLCKLSSLLTDKGKTALQSNEIMDIIDNLTLQRFRVPGAHTGFLPFSVAEESKQYVEEKLPIIETWFI